MGPLRAIRDSGLATVPVPDLITSEPCGDEPFAVSSADRDKQAAEPTLDELQAKLDAEDLASAREAALSLDLDELVSETLGDRVR